MELVRELRNYMAQARLLVVVDNLETLTLQDVRPLLKSIPTGSKILLTSRIGLGELELRYKLDPLDKKQSVSLARRHAKSLNLQLLAGCAEERLGKYCQALFFNPLLIKWFVSSVSNGADPDRLLSRTNQSFSAALQFCFENLYNRLSDAEKRVLHVLFAARRQLSQTELFFLLQEVTQLTQLELEMALNVLHGSSMLKRAFADKWKSDSGTQYALTDVSSEYLARFAPPDSKTLESVQRELKRLRLLADQTRVQEEAYPYDIFIVRAAMADERICAVFLNNALKKARADLVAEARGLVERAKNLLPNFSETYRISAIVEGKGNDFFKADEEIRISIDLNPRSSLTHYQYALFLLREMEDYSSALTQIDVALQIDAGDPTLETARALILTRLGRYEEGAELYEKIIREISAKPRKWRISTLDQAAECYRRWAEVDRQQRDPARQMSHLERSREILEAALARNDYDYRTGSAYTNVVEDAIFAMLTTHDRDRILHWLSRLADATHVINCPPFRILNIDRVADAFPGDAELLRGIEKITYSWRLERGDRPASMGGGVDNEVRAAKRAGFIKRIMKEEKFGFITDSEGHDWFFHFNFLFNPMCWDGLKEGTQVEFAVGTNKRGPCAVDVCPSTAAPHRVQGVGNRSS